MTRPQPRLYNWRAARGSAAWQAGHNGPISRHRGGCRGGAGHPSNGCAGRFAVAQRWPLPQHGAAMLLPLCGLLSGAGAARAARQAHWSRAAAGGRRLAAALGLAQPGPGGAAAPAPHARCAPHFFRSVLLATCRTLGLVQALNSAPAADCSGAATASIRRTVRPAAWDRRGRRDGLGASGPWGPCFCSRAAAPCAGSAVLRAEDICLRTQSGAAAFADTTPACPHACWAAGGSRAACMHVGPRPLPDRPITSLLECEARRLHSLPRRQQSPLPLASRCAP